MKEIIKKSSYSLYRDRYGEFWIEVVCGTIGLYEIKVKLTEQEKSRFNSDPTFLEDLAYMISKNPDQYKDRN